MKQRLRTKLTIAFIALAIIPLLIIGIILSTRSYTTEREEAIDYQQSITQNAAATIELFVENKERILRLTSELLTFQNNDDINAPFLSGLLSSDDTFDDLALVDATGQEQVRVSRLEIVTSADLVNRAADAAFIEPFTTNTPYYGPIQINQRTGESTMIIAVPRVPGPLSPPEGVLIGEIRLSPIWENIISVPFGKSGTLTIIDDQNNVIAHPDRSLVLNGTTFDVPQQPGIYEGVQGQEVVLASSQLPLGDQQVSVMAQLPVSEALAEARNTLVSTIVVIAATLLVALGLIYVVVRQIVRPVQQLATTALAVSAGDYSQTAPVLTNDEIGHLATTFNTMTAQIRQHVDQLEQRVSRRTHELEARNDQLQQAYTDLQEKQSQLNIAEQTLQNLSAPLIPVREDVLLVPLVGVMDTNRMDQTIDLVLEHVSLQQARHVLLDITGIVTFDDETASSLVKLAQMAGLLGAQVTLVGVNPEVAQTIVQLDLPLETIATHATLASALKSLR